MISRQWCSQSGKTWEGNIITEIYRWRKLDRNRSFGSFGNFSEHLNFFFRRTECNLSTTFWSSLILQLIQNHTKIGLLFWTFDCLRKEFQLHTNKSQTVCHISMTNQLFHVFDWFQIRVQLLKDSFNIDKMMWEVNCCLYSMRWLQASIAVIPSLS